MSARTTDELLRELGARVERAARRAPRRRRGRRLVAVAALALLVLGGSAAATRPIWAPDAPSLRPHGPTAHVGEVTGPLALDVRRCARGAVSVVLRVGPAGAATACARPDRPTVAVFLDPSDGRAYAFGIAPPTAVRVTSAAGAEPVLRVDHDVARRAAVPAATRAFAVALPVAASSAAVAFTCEGGVRCGG